MNMYLKKYVIKVDTLPQKRSKPGGKNMKETKMLVHHLYTNIYPFLKDNRARPLPGRFTNSYKESK